jgi:hypothetical protein
MWGVIPVDRPYVAASDNFVKIKVWSAWTYRCQILLVWWRASCWMIYGGVPLGVKWRSLESRCMRQ